MAQESYKKEALELLIGKAVSDPDFRQNLVNDPLRAIDNAGIELTHAQRITLANFDRDELSRMAQDVDTRISRSLAGITTDDTYCNTYSTGW